MTITVNGKARHDVDAQTIEGLVRELNLPPETLLIEHNENPLRRADWSKQALNEGDNIEFVRVVAGG
ncbi:MAG TPA: sulfur carrier protein ThiS [Chthoniobacterales bacterium]|jgi:thiamine biosynthesis protein ThiS